ncbi:MAG: hypothetical protein JWR52_3729 [Marmoricola sp.]|nr:hypothetical protein [Marmoricola sp.]
MGGKDQQALGAYGERVAARHLVEQGMVVLDRNWRCPVGELDLVLRDGDVLVFCEVKTRRGETRGHPLQAVDTIKAQRLRRLAALWTDEHEVRVDHVRLDVVGVTAPRRGPATVVHSRGIG